MICEKDVQRESRALSQHCPRTARPRHRRGDNIKMKINENEIPRWIDLVEDRDIGCPAHLTLVYLISLRIRYEAIRKQQKPSK